MLILLVHLGLALLRLPAARHVLVGRTTGSSSPARAWAKQVTATAVVVTIPTWGNAAHGTVVATVAARHAATAVTLYTHHLVLLLLLLSLAVDLTATRGCLGIGIGVGPRPSGD